MINEKQYKLYKNEKISINAHFMGISDFNWDGHSRDGDQWV